MIIDTIVDKAETITINIYEINKNNIIEVIFPNSIDTLNLENGIKNYINILDINYKITNNNDFFVFKSIQEMF